VGHFWRQPKVGFATLRKIQTRKPHFCGKAQKWTARCNSKCGRDARSRHAPGKGATLMIGKGARLMIGTGAKSMIGTGAEN
jgi:hypothetical protein